MGSTKFPATLGGCVDAAYKLREKRLLLEAQAAELKSEQKSLEDHIFQKFDKEEIGTARGVVATATVTHSTVPTVVDYVKFTKYILKTGQIDLLERRPAREACRTRWDAGEDIPGIEPFDRIGLSLTKVGSKE